MSSVEPLRNSDHVDQEGISVRPWTGGTCPVLPDTQVEITRRYASTATGLACQFNWHHDLYNAYGAEDIVAYRLIAPSPADSR
jgi:hypothetical protein